MRRPASVATVATDVRYRIVVDGRVSPRFAAALAGATIERQGKATTLLAKVETAAELDSLLGRLADLGLELVSLRQTDPA
jgi:hypothetical protein